MEPSEALKYTEVVVDSIEREWSAMINDYFVLVVKNHAKQWPVIDIARYQRLLRQAKDTVAALSAQLNKTYDVLSIHVLAEKMEDEGFEGLKFDGGRVELRPDVSVSVPKSNREDLHDWLRAHGHEDLVTDTVNSSTLKAFYKELTNKKGEGAAHDLEQLNELLKIYSYTRAVIVNA